MSSTAAESAQQKAWRRTLLGMGSCLLWMLFSTALIIFNKRLYAIGFEYPFFVTGMGQVFSAIGGLFMVQSGYLPLRPAPSLDYFLHNLLPIILSTAATMFCGNYSYLYLSVAFIQILKAFTPALTLTLCVLAGMEKFNLPLVLSVLMIAMGTAGAVLIESGTPAFHLIGFLSFMMSSLTEAIRVVGAEVLLGSRYNSAEALIYIGGPAAVVLLLGSAIWEKGVWLSGPMFIAHYPVFFAAFFTSFLVNLSCFFAIQNTSSLTFKVIGCIKNVGVVWYGCVFHGEHVTAFQMVGYFVSVLGFALYSQLKMHAYKLESQKKKKA